MKKQNVLIMANTQFNEIISNSRLQTFVCYSQLRQNPNADNYSITGHKTEKEFFKLYW